MKKFYLFISVALLLLSCNETNVLNERCDSQSGEGQNSHSIPVDSALSYLYSFMDEGEIISRGFENKKVSSVMPIKYGVIKSRSTEPEVTDCDNLVYVVNFENNAGYAILAADDRVGSNVISITDHGVLSDYTVYTALDLVNQERVILEGYPTTGEGFLQFEEYGEEIFMNPNTVSLYDDKVGDTLVGNYVLSDYGAEDDNGNPILGDSIDTSLDAFVTSMCVTYAIGGVVTSGQEQFERQPNPGVIHDDGFGDGSSTGNSSWDETITTDWTVKEQVYPILGELKYWHQSSPFNDLYPKKRKYLFFGHKRKAPAGCFPLSIAKVLTYFGYPTNFSYNGVTINWSELRRNYNSEIGRQSAAALLKAISTGCDSWYFYSGTFTFPHNATSFMRRIGYLDSHSYKYTFDRVTEMLSESSPVIIYSIPGYNVFKSHCWNIDGYKIKERKTIYNKYIGSNVIATDTTNTVVNMVHCDFGWSSKNNGYYVSGVFKLNDPNSEKDDPDNNGGSTNYNHLLKVITYTKPTL